MSKYELLSNFDIIEICEKANINLVDCIGKDLLHKYKGKNGGFVLNLDDSNSRRGGTHWVSLFVYNNNACYFDPFGTLPPLDVLEFCQNKKLVYSKDQIQHIRQECCGYYCIAFLDFFTKYFKYKSFTKLLNLFLKPFNLDNTSQNDNILQSYLKNNINI